MMFGIMLKQIENPDHHKLPVGQVMSAPVKGEFLALPLFGWVSVRAQTRTPLVMMSTLLIKSMEDPTPHGSFNIEFPIFPETEAATLAVLDRFGWDGRVWPTDDGWPEGTETDAEQLVMLMTQAGLRATMTFPPGTHGVKAQLVSIQRAQGPFLMPPLPEPIEGLESPVGLEQFRALYTNPKAFHRPVKPAETTEGMKVREIGLIVKTTNVAKLWRQTKSSCLQLGIPFDGVEDRLEDLDRLAIFITDGLLQSTVRKKAEEWGENEKTLLRDVVRAGLKYHHQSLKVIGSEDLSNVAETLCFSCSVNPATTTGETVPLCSECAAQVTNPRGVNFQNE